VRDRTAKARHVPTPRLVFSPAEVIAEVCTATDRYPEYTIRTEIVSRMCTQAPAHHAVKNDDLDRVGRGQYRRAH
jgi:hypothetical protein